MSLTTCAEIQHDNSLCKPGLAIGSDYCRIKSLQINAVSFSSSDCRLSLMLNVAALRENSDQELRVAGHLIADCRAVDSLHLLTVQSPIPIRFANHYLPLLGIPTIPAEFTRSQLISHFGNPDAEGGGNRSPLLNIPKRLFDNMPDGVMHVLLEAKIPEWIRFRQRDCVLRFEMQSEIATSVTLMPSGEWMDGHGLHSLKSMYCLPEDEPATDNEEGAPL